MAQAMQGRASGKKLREPKRDVYNWEAKEPSGNLRKGEMEAASVAVVRATLRRMGLNPTTVRKQAQPLFGGGRVKEKDIVVMTRQLATMINAGLPVVQAIDLLGKGTGKMGMRKLMMDVKRHLEEGERLSEAFAHFPAYFDRLYVALVAAGEMGGILDTILLKLATYREKSLALKSKIKSAMFYPSAIVTVAFGVTAILMIFVIPRFAQLFTSFGANLPVLTQFVINVSNEFVRYWFLVFGIPIGGVAAMIYAHKHSRRFREGWDRLLLRMPIIGDVMLKGAIARFTRTFSTMHGAGVPMTESLETIARSSGNVVIENAISKARDAVASGTRLSEPLRETGLFPPMVTQMIAIGEESGAMEEMLAKVADFYEGEVDEAVNRMTSLMEPAIMVVLGVIIGTLVISMYLPIFKLGAVVTGGH